MTGASRSSARVLKDYVAQYPDPIAMVPGDVVQVGKFDPEYPGWVWTTSKRTGKSGWVPEESLAIEGTQGRASRAFTAQELTVSAGEAVTIVEELLGWAWVEAGPSRKGWVPLSHLLRIGDTDGHRGP